MSVSRIQALFSSSVIRSTCLVLCKVVKMWSNSREWCLHLLLTPQFGLISMFLLQAVLPNNNVVAVKQLFLKTQEVIDSFINEVVLITNLQHRNLVNLKGFCVSGREMLLVYEYVDNQDLDKVLLSKLNSSIRYTKLMWNVWLKFYNIIYKFIKQTCGL